MSTSNVTNNWVTSNWTSVNGTSSPPTTTSWQLCSDWTQILDISNGVQLSETFRRTVDDIFAVHSSVRQFSAPFSLLLITPQSVIDFNAYYDLLNLSGPVFRTIDRLMITDSNLRYSVFDYSRSLKSSTQANFVELNPFEYYFYRFAQHLLDSGSTYSRGDFDQFDCVYIRLLVDYLSGFFPSDGIYPATVSSTSINITPTKPQWSPIRDRYFEDGQQSNLIRRTPLGLLRQDFYRETTVSTPSPTHSQTRKSVDILWKSTSLLSIFLDSWMNVPEIGQRSNSELLSNAKSSNILISGMVAAINRILVECLHNFSYAPSSSVIDAQLRNFKERHVPKLLAGRMWTYLQCAFDKWPLDSSFRLLLELWLSYIQPWVYAYGNYKSGTDNQRTYDAQWEFFVRDHIGFYTTYFQLTCERFLRMGFDSSKNAMALYRLSTAFNQPGLTEVLGWTQREYSFVGRFDNSIVSGSGFRQLAITVAKRASKMAEKCKDSILVQHESLSKRSWKRTLNSLFTGDNEDSNMIEMRHISECLDAAVRNLENAFYFYLTEEMVKRDMNDDLSSLAADLGETREPDHKFARDGHLQLTPLGRRQILNANRRFDLSRVSYPPDLTPIDPSSEITFLARFLHFISSKINSTYGRKLDLLYARGDGIIGYIFRHLLLAPTKELRKNSPMLERKPTDLGARLNLRPLASYRFLCKFIFLILLLIVMFGYRTVVGSVFVILNVITILFFIVLAYHPAVRNVD